MEVGGMNVRNGVHVESEGVDGGGVGEERVGATAGGGDVSTHFVKVNLQIGRLIQQHYILLLLLLLLLLFLFFFTPLASASKWSTSRCNNSLGSCWDGDGVREYGSNFNYTRPGYNCLLSGSLTR